VKKYISYFVKHEVRDAKHTSLNGRQFQVDKTIGSLRQAVINET